MAVSKKKFPWIDIAIGVLVTAVVLVVFHFQWADPMEYKLYDMRAKLRAQKSVNDSPIILVGINDESIRSIGRWPWPRTYIADAVKQLSEAGAKVIGVDVFFSDKELNPGLDEIRALKVAAAETKKFPPEFASLLDNAEKKLDNDAELENEMAFAQSCVLPMYFQEGQAIGRSTKPIPERDQQGFCRGSVGKNTGRDLL